MPAFYSSCRDDYPSKPIGGTNPYWCCVSCGQSAPAINGRLEGHLKTCAWRVEQQSKRYIVRMRDTSNGTWLDISGGAVRWEKAVQYLEGLQSLGRRDVAIFEVESPDFHPYMEDA